MRILLFGNPSTLHSNLAKGLRELGHKVRTVSMRSGWRQFPVDDILLERNYDINGKLAMVQYLWRALSVLRKCKGYDIVQMHNPMFLALRGSLLRPFYDYIRRNNSKIILGAFGDDYHIVNQMLNSNTLRYSDQKIGSTIRQDAAAVEQRERWIGNSQYEIGISKYVSEDCDAIVACLQEYWALYNNVYPEKLHFIPLPIVMPDKPRTEFSVGNKVKLFIGIQKDRTQVKGTDIMLKAAQDIVRDFPTLAELRIVENVPYEEYTHIMEGSDAILDQLYSYTPSMNSLLAMSKGIIDIGGGEPENYAIINEHELHPIVNVEPSYESVYHELKELIHHRERIPAMKAQSVEYVKRHHDYRRVAAQYLELYQSVSQ